MNGMLAGMIGSDLMGQFFSLTGISVARGRYTIPARNHRAGRTLF